MPVFRRRGRVFVAGAFFFLFVYLFGFPSRSSRPSSASQLRSHSMPWLGEGPDTYMFEDASMSDASFSEEIIFRPSSFDWSTIEESFPLPRESMTGMPARPRKLPKVQFQGFQTSDEGASGIGAGYKHDAETENRRVAVRNAFVRCWDSYRRDAWLMDELKPLSGGGKNTFGGWAATLVDSLDTLWIMGLKDEFQEAAKYAVAIDFADTTDKAVNLFETTIRHLGGLLSAYDLSGEKALLQKAIELGDMLYHAFDTPNRIPPFWFHFSNAKIGLQKAGNRDPAAAPTSLALEFSRLAQITGNAKYWDAIERIRVFLADTQDHTLLPGIWPTTLNFARMKADEDRSFTLGGLADSLFEYLLKGYILWGGDEETDIFKVAPVWPYADEAQKKTTAGKQFAKQVTGVQAWKDMYLRAMAIVEKELIFRAMIPDPANTSDQGWGAEQATTSSSSTLGDLSAPKATIPRIARNYTSEQLLFSGTAWIRDNYIQLSADPQHLGCFAGGMLALGGKIFGINHHVDLGMQITKGCAWAYAVMPSGIMPEIFSLLPCVRNPMRQLPGNLQDGNDERDLLSPCVWDEQRWLNEAFVGKFGGRSSSSSRQSRGLLSGIDHVNIKNDEKEQREIRGSKKEPKPIKYVRDARYLLRPEAVESIFILWRVTGDEEFREVAWQMFEDIMRETTTPLGNAAIKDVRTREADERWGDSMESFWMAETLKYFYLIFSPPDIISLDEWVLNTEAHPFRRPNI